MKKAIHLVALMLVASMLLLSFPTFVFAKIVVCTTPEGYNEHDYQKVRAFLEIADENGIKNGTKLNPNNYDPDNPETFSVIEDEEFGFLWTEAGGELRLSMAEIYRRDFVGNLDLSGCTELLELSCARANLDSVNVSNCTSLEIVITDRNQNMASLDVTGCTSLTWLECERCLALTRLAVTSNTALEYLSCAMCPLITELDITNNHELTVLSCLYCSSLTELDTTQNPLLEELNVAGLANGGIGISELNLSNNIHLRNLSCDMNGLTELDVSACPDLCYFTCTLNDFREFDFTNNPLLILREIRAEGGGFVGCYISNEIEVEAVVQAYPEEGWSFDGWFNENGQLISTDEQYYTYGEEGTVFIARFSGGPEPLPGDVDASGEVEVSDAILALRGAMGVLELAPEQFTAADMDGDGTIGLDDAITILRTAMGLLSKRRNFIPFRTRGIPSGMPFVHLPNIIRSNINRWNNSAKHSPHKPKITPE